MVKKYYKCDCGEEFTESNKFNAHKRHCRVHIEKTKKFYLLNDYLNTLEIKEKKRINRLIKKEEDINKWVSEKHMCEHCGKIMTEKYGSGRFCSMSCANSGHIPSAASRIKLGLNREGCKINHERAVERYENNPKFCDICGKKLPYNLRKRKVCSKECLHITHHNRALKTVSNQHNNKKQYKFGTFNNIPCDSSWELAYVVYNLEEKNICVIRNTTGFKYSYHNEEHTYYPDFILPDGTYIEIKNYWTEEVQAKIDQFPKDLKYKILYYEDIKYMIDYCINKYGKKFYDVLYTI